MTTAFHTLEVSAVLRETPDCTSFELAVPSNLREAYRYRAGQHITFEVAVDGVTLHRCYSLASCPELGEPLKIGVKRVEGGRVSNWLNDNLQVGDALRASVPEGRFVLDQKTRPTTPLFLFAGGSGITPIISLLKSALHSTDRPVTLVYANRDPASVVYRDELDHLAEAHADRLRVHHHLDSDRGHLHPNEVAALVHHADIAECYICGPDPFMEMVERTLRGSGVHEELIYIERFVSPADRDPANVDAVDVDSLPAPAVFSLWLNGRSRTVPYQRGQTLLESARAAGLDPPHSCESGFCGSCMSAVKSGKVVMRTHEALTERDVSRGVALLCQSFPASADPLELDADSTSFRTASAVKSSYSKAWSRLAAAAVFACMVAGTLVLRLVH